MPGSMGYLNRLTEAREPSGSSSSRPESLISVLHGNPSYMKSVGLVYDQSLTFSVDDPTSGEVVGGECDSNLVPGYDPDVVFPHFP